MYPSKYLGVFVIAFLIGVALGSFIALPWFLGFVFLLFGLAMLIFMPSKFLIVLAILGFALGMIDMQNHPEAWTHTPKSITQKALAVRDVFISGLQKAVPEPEATFLGGILVGARFDFSPEMKSEFRRTGTSHIIAISGYNVTIIANVVALILSFIFPRKFAIWIIIGSLLFFMVLTGAQTSVIRATIMGISVVMARFVGRLPTPLHTLLLAAGVMVALEPQILRHDIGFQLSVLATIGILVVAPLIQSRFRWLNKLGSFGELVAMTLSAQLCVTPLLLYYFETFSISSLPVNLIILPFIPMTMLFGFMSGVMGYVPIFGKLFGLIPWLLSAFILKVIHFFSEQNWSVIALPLPFWAVVGIYVLGGLFFAKIYHANQERALI